MAHEIETDDERAAMERAFARVRRELINEPSYTTERLAFEAGWSAGREYGYEQSEREHRAGAEYQEEIRDRIENAAMRARSRYR